MSRPDYSELDKAILCAIGNRVRKFSSITHSVYGLAVPYASEFSPAWRVVDRRLQALRKQGRIRYSRGLCPCWVTRDAAPSADGAAK